MNRIPVQVGSIVGGRYRVERVLGAGTMGVVVAARHLELEATVAIKFLNPELGTDEACERFRREVRAAAQLRSEHVARVLDVGELDDGLPFMVMDLLLGRSLAEELELRGALPVEEAVSHVLQAIEALAEAHAAGIIHRDLKPANLFLARRSDGTCLVKVIDFGVSKSLDECSSGPNAGLTRTGMVVGSPLYMPPEQLVSPRTLEASADIWALGVVLFELLTARTPYSTGSIAELYAMLLRDAPALPSSYRADLPAGLEAVIMRCLKRDPKERFQTVSELGAALSPFAPTTAIMHVERASRTQPPDAVPAEIAATISESRATGCAEECFSATQPSAVSAPKETGSAWHTTQRREQSRSSPLFYVSLLALLALGGLSVQARLGRSSSATTMSPASAAAGVQSATDLVRDVNPALAVASAQNANQPTPPAVNGPIVTFAPAAPAERAASLGLTRAWSLPHNAAPSPLTHASSAMGAGEEERSAYRLPNFGGRR